VPRPEWYFLFLFELLKVFKNQNAFLPVIMATFLVPNLLLGLLILWPFIDRGPERRIWKRPVSMVVAILTIAFLAGMTYKGATTPEGGGAIPVEVPESDAAALAGRQLAEDSGCLSCHNIGGVGGAVGPNLTDQGNKGRGIQWQIDHLKDPASKVPGSTMPPFANLTDEQANQLAEFLEGLGTKYTAP